MTSTVISQRPAFCTFHSSQVIASTYQLDSDSNSRAGSLHFLNPKDLSSLRVVPTPAGVFRFEIVGDTIVSALTDGSLHYISLTGQFNLFLFNCSHSDLVAHNPESFFYEYQSLTLLAKRLTVSANFVTWTVLTCLVNSNLG